jgi:hypothetical protein
VRLDLDTLDDAPACSQVAPPALRGGRGVAAAARPPQAPIPFPSTAPAPVLTDGHTRGGSPRPDGWGEPAR